jgi:hypothetical protein
MIPTITLRHALTDPELLAGALPGETFSTWRTILIGMMGEPLTDAECAVFGKYTDREPPSEPVREAAYIIGRRGGKDRAIAAVRPTLLTTGGILCQISSAYARKGELFEAYHKHYGPKGDDRVLVVKGASLDFNPTLDRAEIERAYREDPEAAAAEYGGEFRNDIRAFVPRDVIMACVDEHVLERQPHAYADYFAFADPSGGSSDSFTLAIGHAEEGGRVILDCLREVMPPFSPESVVDEFCADLRRYRVTTVTAGRPLRWPVAG